MNNNHHLSIQDKARHLVQELAQSIDGIEPDALVREGLELLRDRGSGLNL